MIIRWVRLDLHRYYVTPDTIVPSCFSDVHLPFGKWSFNVWRAGLPIDLVGAN